MDREWEKWREGELERWGREVRIKERVEGGDQRDEIKEELQEKEEEYDGKGEKKL